MQLKEINKQQYRQRLNSVIIAFIASFMVLAIAFGTLLIAAFSDGETSNFRFNLLGVILALLALAAVLHQMRSKPLFNEIYYVWQLKQIQNLIYRKLTKVKEKASQNDADALLCLLFYYTSQKQVYELDDNTLTMSALVKDIENLNQQINESGKSVNLQDFDKDIISQI